MSKNENILDKHIEILQKETLTDEDIDFLLKNIPKVTFLKREDIKKIQKILELANKHKDKILKELSKYKQREKAFYEYNIENPNVISMSKKV